MVLLGRGLFDHHSVIMLRGSMHHFLVGLGITEVFGVLGQKMGGIGSGLAFALSLGIAGMFVLLGYLARKVQLWAFVVGMILYALDAFLFVSSSDFFSVAFHALALCFLFAGVAAARKWSELKPIGAPLG